MFERKFRKDKYSKYIIISILAQIILLSCCYAKSANNKIPQKIPNVQKLTNGFKFTEGPATDKKGNIYFTDIPNNRIHKWSVDGKLSTFMKNSKGANGLIFDKMGNLLACLGGAGKLVSISPKGKITVLASTYQGKPFNSPNDLWIHPKGGIYFTDPRYGNRENLPQDGEHVYYLSADRKTVTRVINDMVRPNGIIGTADGNLLYVADHGASKTYSYKINSDGTLSNKKLFAKQGSDGMTLDADGNVYLTGQTVDIYNPSCKLIKKIQLPETPSNVCFYKKNWKKLFVTARKSLYSVDMENKLYSFTMNDIDGKAVSLSQYQGKVVLVVNVASKCGFTKQYAGLQQLYEKYKDKGFVILGFPANNFLWQEPGTDSEIKSFCTIKYNVTFPMFSKISVKGKNIHPLYQYLTNPEENGEFGKPIKWNFNKFLIGKDGKTITRFPSKTVPMDDSIMEAIEMALKE